MNDLYFDSEKKILGGIIHNNSFIIELVAQKITENFFEFADYRLIYKAMLELQKTSSLIDEVTIVSRLQKIEGGEKITIEFLKSLSASYFGGGIKDYVNIIKDNYGKKVLEKVAGLIIKNPEKKNYDELLISLQSEVKELSNDFLPTHTQTASEAAESFLDEFPQPKERGLSLGLGYLDKILAGGLDRGRLMVIAGRTHQGKTMYCINLFKNLIVRNVPCLFISLEMRNVEIMRVLLSQLSDVPWDIIKRGYFNNYQKEEQKIRARLKEIADGKYPFTLSESSYNNRLAQLENTIRQETYKNKTRIVFVDYLQLITSGENKNSTAEDISEVCRRLKLLALELNISIIAPSQLNRELDKQRIKQPNLSHLKSSGGIEENADIILAINRPYYYNKDAQKDLAEIFVLKNRCGDLAKFDTLCKAETLEYKDEIEYEKTEYPI